MACAFGLVKKGPEELYTDSSFLSDQQKLHRPLEPDKARDITWRETLKDMLNTLVEVATTLLHSFFFYDIIIVGRPARLLKTDIHLLSMI